MAETGDLLLILGDNVKRSWKQIIYFKSGEHTEQAVTKSPAAIALPTVGSFSLDDKLEIISDERGVRIARDEESD